MGEIIVLIVVFIVWGIKKAILENKVDNYDISNISVGKMSMDIGKSDTEIKRNMVSGKYDKDENWKY